MPKSEVIIKKVNPFNVLGKYEEILALANYKQFLAPRASILIKLNLSWTKYFPSCSSAPWQLEGVLNALLEDGYPVEDILAVENKTVVTDPRKGALDNAWIPVLRKYGISFRPLPEVEWIKYDFQSRLLRLPKIFPKGIEIPKMFLGKNVIHLPTMKTHGHSTTTGAIKNSFGGLLREIRHYAHKYIHEVLVDLMIMQQEIHPGIFAVMDATVCGDGAGPRTMIPRIKNYILASGDCVALDAVAAKMMGFDPMSIPYLRMCHEKGLGVADIREIDIVGEDISKINFDFHAKRSLVIWGDQMLRRGPLRFLERIALHSPLVVWAPFASNLYHDWLWYPTIGKWRIRKFMKTEWGRLFQNYKAANAWASRAKMEEYLLEQV